MKKILLIVFSLLLITFISALTYLEYEKSNEINIESALTNYKIDTDMITITPDIKKLAILSGVDEGDIANSNFKVVYGDKEGKSISLDTVIDDDYKVKYRVSYNNEKLFNPEFNIKKTGIITIDKSKIQAILSKNLPVYIETRDQAKIDRDNFVENYSGDNLEKEVIPLDDKLTLFAHKVAVTQTLLKQMH